MPQNYVAIIKILYQVPAVLNFIDKASPYNSEKMIKHIAHVLHRKLHIAAISSIGNECCPYNDNMYLIFSYLLQ